MYWIVLEVSRYITEGIDVTDPVQQPLIQWSRRWEEQFLGQSLTVGSNLACLAIYEKTSFDMVDPLYVKYD